MYKGDVSVEGHCDGPTNTHYHKFNQSMSKFYVMTDFSNEPREPLCEEHQAPSHVLCSPQLLTAKKPKRRIGDLDDLDDLDVFGTGEVGKRMRRNFPTLTWTTEDRQLSSRTLVSTASHKIQRRIYCPQRLILNATNVSCVKFGAVYGAPIPRTSQGVRM